MGGFKSLKQAQRFLNNFGTIYDCFQDDQHKMYPIHISDITRKKFQVLAKCCPKSVFSMNSITGLVFLFFLEVNLAMPFGARY